MKHVLFILHRIMVPRRDCFIKALSRHSFLQPDSHLIGKVRKPPLEVVKPEIPLTAT